MNESQHQVFFGDAREMDRIPDSSVQLIITSPPYWQLKDYGSPQQIGFHNTYEEYINNLNLVWMEVYRILDFGCRFCINVGDQFTRTTLYGRYRVLPIRSEIIRFCQTIGLDYMGAIIWQKRTTTNTTGGATIMGSYPFPRNGILKIDYEFILIFRKPGKSPSPTSWQKELSRISREEWNTYFSGHWEIPGEKQRGHIAVFPLEIPLRLIRMFSFSGDMVVDPFCGSGTTLQAAALLGRQSSGYEINRQYMEHIKDRFDHESASLSFHEIELQPDITRRLNKLPYVFEDPYDLNNRKDLKSMNFGSRMDKIKKSREEYFRIRKILSPTEIMLNNNRKLRLLGIRVIPDKSAAAIEYLYQKTKGQRIYTRNDPNHPEDHVYLYLENRTLLNAHLIKNSLAGVETAIDYKMKKRFLSYL